MKRLFRSVVAGILEWQVKVWQRKSSFKTIAIVGSIGKTSTKIAIAQALERIGPVRFQHGNYNDRVTVPLVVFGKKSPGKITSVFSWLRIISANFVKLLRPASFDWLVVELGVDGPNQMKDFGYLSVDLAVVTALSDEHMEHFSDLEAVAHEELTVAEFSKELLINSDLCDKTLLTKNGVIGKTYGQNPESDIQIRSNQQGFTLSVADKQVFLSQTQTPLIKQYCAAAALAVLLFAKCDDQAAIESIIKQTLSQQTPGRMQELPGIKGSIIIDDSYNSSPKAVSLALDALQAIPAKKKIAILGSMNELGDTSESSHVEVGGMCSPRVLDLLVTIGTEANAHLAPAAEKNGCRVETFNNPFDAGIFVKEHLGDGALILVKGSQNGVFAEEAIKPLLKNAADESKLVRQSKSWLTKKRHQFGQILF